MGEAEQLDLNALAAGLPRAKVEEVVDFIGYLRAKWDRELPPMLRDAPLDDEPLTPEEVAALDAAKAEAGTISLGQIKAELGL